MLDAPRSAGALAAPCQFSGFLFSWCWQARPTPAVLSWLGTVGLLAGEAAHGNAPVPIRGANGCYGWLAAGHVIYRLPPLPPTSRT